MSEISDYEARVGQALTRIRAAAERLAATAAEAPPAPDMAPRDEAELARLRQELDDEKLASAQLEQRVKTLHDRQTGKLETLERTDRERREAMAGLDAELGRMRAHCDRLRETSAALREANAAGVGEPHLINKAMLAELESLRAARSADRAELDAVLGELTRLSQSEGAA